MSDFSISANWSHLSSAESIKEFLTPKPQRLRRADQETQERSSSASYITEVWRLISSSIAAAVSEFFASSADNPLQVARRDLILAHKEAERRKLKAHLDYGDNFRVSSINAIREKHLDACFKPIIRKPILQEIFQGTPIVITDITLDKPYGVCVGESLWIITSFLHALARVPEEELDDKLIIKILEREARKCSKGAPDQATLLAYVWELIGISSTEIQEGFIQSRPQMQKTIGRIKDTALREQYINNAIAKELLIKKLLHLKIEKNSYLNSRPSEANKESIASLARGIYFTDVPGHSLAYFKFSPTLGYIFDPNYGLIKFSGRKHCAEVEHRLNEYNKKKSDPRERFMHMHRLVLPSARPLNFRTHFV